MPNLQVTSVGSSHYKGDIYIDLATKWIRKATIDETVVTETTIPVPLNTKINEVVERNITIRNIGKE